VIRFAELISTFRRPKVDRHVDGVDLGISFATTASFDIMAELAAAATIIQLVQFSGVILTSCYDYISKAKSASGDIEKVINDVSGLEGILKRLHSLISDGEDERHALLKSLERPNGPFRACSQSLEELQKRLKILTEASSARRKLLWPLEEKKILEILRQLGEQKQTFILALAGDHAFSDEANAKQGKEAIDKLNEMKIKDERNKILNWLRGADPSTNYNTARKKHEKGTGDWLLQSEQFQTWKDANSHIMWLYGIPGAGKTILRFVSPL
jgi:ankyrin repeat domain-containing protein 50